MSSTARALSLRRGSTAFVLASFGLCPPSATRGGPGAPFTEEALSRGINYFTPYGSSAGRGLALPDLDADGDPDIVLIGSPSDVVGVYENDGAGHFIDRSPTSGIAPLSAASGVVAADYDGDGDLDVYVARWLAPNVLLRNDGGFKFADVTTQAGVGDPGAGTGCTWADYDGDGWLDLYVANMGPPISPSVSRLFRNLGDGTFVDVAEALGVQNGSLNWQSVFFDFDDDGDPDLYLSNDKAVPPLCRVHNYLFENLGGTFADITDLTDTGACIFSMGVAVGDFDRNGLQDLYCTNFPPGNPLFMNMGEYSFVESSVPAGVGSYATGWGAVLFDFDNDGFQDLYVCNQDASNRLYRHEGKWPCADVAAAMGVADPEQSYGVAVGDVDLDGDLDMLVQNDFQRIRLYINHAGDASHWLKVRLVGDPPNRFAVGATIRVRTAGTWHMRQVLAGTNFKSQNELMAHFGLGSANSVDEIVVRWPGGDVREFPGGPVDVTRTLCQSEPPGATTPAPTDGAVDVAMSTQLQWSSSNTQGFVVRFGVSHPPPVVATTESTHWSPGVLQPDRDYFWQIDTHTADCGLVPGHVWSFRTESGVVPDNTLTVRILAPTAFGQFLTTATTVTLGGMASDETGVASVTWANARGGSGSAATSNGWATWIAAGVPLEHGQNVITVTAKDSDGHTHTDPIAITRLMPAPVSTPVESIGIVITAPTTDPAHSTASESIDLGGTATGPVTSVVWQNSLGGQGPCSGANVWTRPGLRLIPGVNVITVTAMTPDGQTASDVITVTYREAIAPFIRISGPSSAERIETEAASISLQGSASDNEGVVQVVWSSSSGDSGLAQGTTQWQVTDVALVVGENRLTLTAFDAAGNQASDTVTIVRLSGAEPAAGPAESRPASAHDDTRAAESVDPPPPPARANPRRLCGIGLALCAPLLAPCLIARLTRVRRLIQWF